MVKLSFLVLLVSGIAAAGMFEAYDRYSALGFSGWILGGFV